jgi:hypothetical protein
MLIGPLMLLTACTATGSGNDCVAWRPILISASDQFTDQTARAILAHNLTGQRLCGW